FALTMLIMTAVSLFISFTLTPILCSKLLKPKKEGSLSLLGRMERGWNGMFDRFVNVYRSVLVYFEKHRFAAIVLLVLILVALLHSLTLPAKLGTSMISEADRGELYLKLEYPSWYNIEHTQRRLREAEELLSDLPELHQMLSMIGKVEGMFGQSSEGVYLAQILLKFSERDERAYSLHDLKQEIYSRLAGYPDAIISVNMPSAMGGQSTDIELEIAGDTLSTLDNCALKIKQFVDHLSGIKDSDTTVRSGKPEIRVYPRRAVLADLGYPATGLGMTLRANLEGIEAGTFKQGARTYDIVVKLEEREGKEQIEQFLFPGAPGHPLLLTNLSTLEDTLAPVQITRKDKRRVSKLFANLDGKKPLGIAVNELATAIDQKGNLPPGYHYKFAGIYEVMAEGQGNLAEAGMIAIILVMLSLAAIMESYKQPILILVTLPLAVIGMLWALAIAGKSIEIFVLMSGVMLIGIVVNNAILIIDQFNIHIQEGVPLHKAMISATCERFRPIVMITLAAVLGMMPLALGRGIGAEMRNATGIASAGGILVSGILTLVVIPILYDLCTRGNQRKKISEPPLF
ncbi:MAG: efflux RND transporter permease subunit, partial [bacterium]